ncbi:hypothetical protein [Aureimonas populi]|uniref:Transcriptional regulator n=1 Tax=Aureimonas populi TaxID=1701758 RepID=A0ABW5CJC0_9HYPH|nr:hypothetical protein [Aureimonas populi]
MNAMEQSLRRALEGGDPSDPAFRLSIYEASARAMERTLANRERDSARDSYESERLVQTIESVEAEYAARYGNYALGEAGAPGGEAGEPPLNPAADPFAEPDEIRHSRPPASFEPADANPAADEGAQEALWRPGSERGPARRRAGAGHVLLGLLFLVVLFGLAAYALGFFGASSAPQSDEPAVEGQADRGAPAREEAAEAPANGLSWIGVFSGGELEQLAAPDGARMETVDEAGRAAVRLSVLPETEAEVLVSLGPGLVQQIAGSTVRIELIAGSPDEELREFSVRCVFGSESVCERQRFATAMPEEAFVFDVAVPGGATGPASLAIGPGLAETGAVDLYSVRMRIL